MPPLFVDGVEIKTLFVDGVEQDSAYADGVEVFSSGQYMLDDFGRSANGTPVSSHVMNTGQTWNTWTGNQPTIQTFHGLQQAYWSRTGNIGSAGFTMAAIPLAGLPTPVAYYATARTWWNVPGTVLTSGTYGQIYMRGGDGTYQNNVRFNHSSDPEVSTITGLSIRNQLGVLQDIAMPWANGSTNYDVFLEIWTDGVEFQGRATSVGQSALSNRFPVQGPVDACNVGSICNFFGNTLKEAGVSDFELTEFSPGSVPWPN